MELFVYHNSREKNYRLPQGALKCREQAVLKLRLWGYDHASANCSLRLWTDEGELLVCGDHKRDWDGTTVEFSITAPENPQLIWYYFIIDVCSTRLYYGAKSGVGRLTDSLPDDYQITVYEDGFKTPEWFRRCTVYQIFPDRFRRGKADASGKTALDRLAYHENLGRKVSKHEDWSEPVNYKPRRGEKFYSPTDYFGGDLCGIREKLPYLASLGVGVIYLNPIFEAPSNHRYNTADYLRVDPVLGDEDELKRLVDEARALGIRIMLDGVFSHTGDDSVYFNRFSRYPDPGAYSSKHSPYYEWYSFERYPNEYRCWWGFKSLPEVREMTPSYMQFVCSVLEKWAKLGLTSWRLDVADELPDAFIEHLRTVLKRIDGDGVLLGEVWEDASNKLWEQGLRKYVYGRELDSVMNYPFRDAVIDFFTEKTDANALVHALGAQRENYPEPFYRAALNLLGSHDCERILTVLSGAPAHNELTREQQAAFTPDKDALELGKKRLVAAAALQFSMPQPPCVYYGDEAGMIGLYDPFNRETFPWGGEDAELSNRYRLLGKLRQKKPALNYGKAAFAALGDDVFAVIREHDGDSVITLVNRSVERRTITLHEHAFYEGPDAGELPFAERYVDLIGGKYADAISRTTHSFTLNGCGSAILLACSKRGKL